MKRFIPILFVFFIVGCYDVALDLPDHIKKIYIQPAVNKTFEYELEEDVTRAIREEFLADGRLIVVDKKEAADAILETTITKYILQPLAFDVNRNPTENRIVIYTLFRFIDKVEGRELWKDDTLYGQTTFSKIKIPPETETDARLRAAKDLAILAANRVLEGWETISRTER